MRCRACRGWRDGDVVHMPHEETCMGATNTGSVQGTAPRCVCDCTPPNTKDDLERQYHYRSWVKLTRPLGPEDVGVKIPEHPLENEMHVTFRTDEYNTDVQRLTRDAANELTAQLVAHQAGGRWIDTVAIAQLVAHAIHKARSGTPTVEDICKELPMGMDMRVARLLLEMQDNAVGV